MTEVVKLLKYQFTPASAELTHNEYPDSLPFFFTQTDNHYLLDQCFLLQTMTRHAIVHYLILLFILFSFSFTRKITVQYISCFYVKGACTTLHLGVILIYLLHANFDKICTIKWRIWMCKNIIVWKHSMSVLLFLSLQNYWKSWANWRQFWFLVWILYFID